MIRHLAEWEFGSGRIQKKNKKKINPMQSKNRARPMAARLISVQTTLQRVNTPQMWLFLIYITEASTIQIHQFSIPKKNEKFIGIVFSWMFVRNILLRQKLKFICSQLISKESNVYLLMILNVNTYATFILQTSWHQNWALISLSMTVCWP